MILNHQKYCAHPGCEKPRSEFWFQFGHVTGYPEYCYGHLPKILREHIIDSYAASLPDIRYMRPDYGTMKDDFPELLQPEVLEGISDVTPDILDALLSTIHGANKVCVDRPGETEKEGLA